MEFLSLASIKLKKKDKTSDDYLNNHNKYGPSIIKFNYSGLVCKIEYFINGKLHRFGNPANLFYYNTSNSCELGSEGYCLNGKLHNSTGPAYRKKHKYSNWVNSYYLNGKRLSRGDFFERYYKTHAQF